MEQPGGRSWGMLVSSPWRQDNHSTPSCRWALDHRKTLGSGHRVPRPFRELLVHKFIHLATSSSYKDKWILRRGKSYQENSYLFLSYGRDCSSILVKLAGQSWLFSESCHIALALRDVQLVGPAFSLPSIYHFVTTKICLDSILRAHTCGIFLSLALDSNY